jgi:ATP-dependent exoDNAse (exonuclease V) alpha subunit
MGVVSLADLRVAIYHLSIKTVGRAAGRSAPPAAANRAGQRISDRASGEVFDYTRKRGVEHSEIVLPTSAAQRDINWARDRQALWNAAERAEKRKDARVAREYELALPHELNRTQRTDLVRAFSGYIANRYGVAVDFAIHKPHRAGDARNHHAHVLTTTREVTPTGLGAKTALELSETDRAKKTLPHSRVEFVEIRGHWATLSNEYLRQHGHGARIDHRTLSAQGIDRQPTVHLGVAVTGLARRGVRSQVEKRIAGQEQQLALQRLEFAKEMGALARERQQVDAGLLKLNVDLRVATPERRAGRSNEDAQKKSRTSWLEYRTHPDAAKSGNTTQSRERDRDRGREEDRGTGMDEGHGHDGPDDDFSA